ncbi:MAG: phosphoribosylglycinamide formyltransferase [Endomicrobium sp.]|jgi:phosphoribosylglycinamide formyltransferase-1|nr:phosphoribosylglycinamide formyltransferase [Endomicrobium sp.]
MIVKRICVFASGNGSNLQSIVNSTNHGVLKGLASVVLVISDNNNAYALERAKKENIRSICIEDKKFENDKFFNDVILDELYNMSIDIICLAGYLKLINKKIIKKYRGRILNVHPSLLPKFGGKGMYGNYVHEAVVKSGEHISGATVHIVDENYDTGEIILQKKIKIFKNDTSNDVSKKVLGIEHRIYPKAIKKIIKNL